MALRIVEIVLPVDLENRAKELLEGHHVDELPTLCLNKDLLMLRFILEAEETEEVTESFLEVFGTFKEFRVNIIPLAATLPEHLPREDVEKERKREEAKAAVAPVPSEPPLAEEPVPPIGHHAEDAPLLEAEGTDKCKERRRIARISRDELYSELSDAVKLNRTYLVLVALSVLVAAVGLVGNNVAVIIGAMVIAPLLAPNVALSLSTTLANRNLAGKALVTLGAGLLLALGIAFLLGVFLQVDPTSPEIALRTDVTMGDMLVGLAAGAAAALFFSIGAGTALVGVTVAAALLPPLVVTGILLGSGEIDLATQSLLLLVSNLVGINLAGTVVFILLGVWPSSWWDEWKAKRSALIAVGIWIVLFAVLLFILLVVEGVLKI